ncbi:MAG: Hvo_1808 family surface protein [Halobacteriales archaeon]
MATLTLVAALVAGPVSAAVGPAAVGAVDGPPASTAGDGATGPTAPGIESPGPVGVQAGADEAVDARARSVGDRPDGAIESPARSADAAPPDPETDVLGWENGYWYNESIDVDQTDGLDESEMDALVGRAMARVEYIRRLEFRRDVHVEPISRAELAERRNGTFGFPASNQLWEALFLFGEDTSASYGVREALHGNVLGYAAEEGADHIVMVTETPESPRFSEWVLVHELVHMLQHQHFDLDRSRYQRTTLDGEFGKDGLVEGEASLVDRRFRELCAGGWDCSQAPRGWGGAEFPGPSRFYWLTYQPYAAGTEYVAALRERGGWTAVDRAHEDPPETSEQFLHPEASDAPAEMAFEDLAGDGWTRRADYQRVGELGIHALFRGTVTEAGGAADFTAGPAEGWANDGLYAYEREGQQGYVWKTRWETRENAGEFAAAYRELLGAKGGERVEPGVWVIPEGPFADAFRVRRQGRTVTVVNAPTRAALAEIRPRAAATDDPSRSATTAPPGATTTSTDGSTTPGRSSSMPATGRPLLYALVGLSVVLLSGVAVNRLL